MVLRTAAVISLAAVAALLGVLVTALLARSVREVLGVPRARLDDDAAIALVLDPAQNRYLGEAPNGEFASEALGRKLVAVQSVSGPQAARPIAKEYLRRFPRGGYATKARELAAQ